MRNWLVLGSVSLLAACGSSAGGNGGGSGSNVTCGTGTTLQGNMCVGDGSGSVTCGTGTHLAGSTCVPDGPAASAAPTVTAITPDHAGVFGSVLFTITGTGFAGSDITDLHVFFGDPNDPNCTGEATLGAATATTLSGEVPTACTLNPNTTVTVKTNLGTATTGFRYVALWAADSVNAFSAGGGLYIIDPYAGVSAYLTTPSDASQNTYYIDGLAFDSTGVLYGVTTGASPGDLGQVPQLVTISTTTGVVTALGDLTDGTDSFYVTDLKVSGTTLFGWAYNGTTGDQSLVSISTTDGAVTVVGTPTASTFVSGGLAIDSTGTAYVAANGAGADATTGVNSTGELDTINTTTGALTSIATLDYPIGAPIDALEIVDGSMIGIVDNNWYGSLSGQTQLSGESVVLIDPANAQQIVGVLFEAPAEVGAQSWVGAIAVPPSSATTIQRKLDRSKPWTNLAKGGASLR